MFESVLVANRGEIARRIIATARRMGIRTIAVYSEADQALPYVHEADEALLIGPPPPARSYLDAAAVIGAARRSGAAAVHPGYGFLAENAGFAQRVIDEGLIWVGPPPSAIEQMGDKINARNLMEKAGVPVSAGSREPVADEDAAAAEAARIGYPVMVKAAGGGGGIGMSAARDEQQLRAAFGTARSRAERFFGNAAMLIERYTPRARHVEVQILGLADGTILALGERDCSVQRRHQKVAEETPSPGVTPRLRERMLEAAVRAGEAVGYRGAGTVECLVDADTGEFSFLEMNTRLQVEHPVTELVTGIDLVEQQFLIAAAAGCGWRACGQRACGRRAAGLRATDLRATDLRATGLRVTGLRGRPAGTVRPMRPRDTHLSSGSTRRTRGGSCPALVRSPSGRSRRARASGWTRDTLRGPRSRRSTTHCSPSSACTERAATRRSAGPEMRSPRSASRARRPTSPSTPNSSRTANLSAAPMTRRW